MRWFLMAAYGFLAALLLTATARADAISAPIGVVLLEKPLPFLLVGAVVLITAVILWKFWRKKR